MAAHAGAALPGAHAQEHVRRPDEKTQKRGGQATARPYQEAAQDPPILGGPPDGWRPSMFVFNWGLRFGGGA